MPINRYQQLLTSLPRGNFYDAGGHILPFRDRPYELKFITDTFNTTYGIFLNNVYLGDVITEVDGNASIYIQFDLGRNVLKLINPTLNKTIISYITTKNISTLLAGIAEQVETIDAGIQQTLEDRYLPTASADTLGGRFAKLVGLDGLSGYSADAYKDIIQELTIAYIYYGGTVEGLRIVVGAFTSVPPTILDRNKCGRWLLGSNIVVNDNQHIWTTTDALTNILASGISTAEIVGYSNNFANTDVDISVQLGLFDNHYRVSAFASSAVLGTTPVVVWTGLDTMRLQFPPKHGSISTLAFPMELNANTDTITLEIDNKGPVVILLTVGTASPYDVANAINGTFSNNKSYGSAYLTVATVSVSVSAYYVTITSPTGGPIKICNNPYENRSAAQVLFNVPFCRAILGRNHSIGETTLDVFPDIVGWPIPSTTSKLKAYVGGELGYIAGEALLTHVSDVLETREIVEITNISGRVITLSAPLSSIKKQNATIELVGQLPFETVAATSTYIDLKITGQPRDSNIYADTITVIGTGLPSGWIRTHQDGSAAAPVETTIRYLSGGTTAPVILTSDLVVAGQADQLTVPLVDISKFAGRFLIVNVLLGGESPNVTDNITLSSVGISADGGATFLAMDYVSPEIPENICTNMPRNLIFRLNIPSSTTADGYKIRLHASQLSRGRLLIHKVMAHVPVVHDSLMLGTGTVPRNESRAKRGSLMHMWNTSLLTDNERSILGADIPHVLGGNQIDKIIPTYSSMDRDEIPYGANIFGIISENDINTATLTNVGVTIRDPSKFSYLSPMVISGQIITAEPSYEYPYYFNLLIESDEDILTSVLFEDGIPLQQDTWTYVSNNQIEFLFVPNADKTYTFNYTALIRIESDVFMVQSPDGYAWALDSHMFIMPDIKLSSISKTVQVTFDAVGRAVLPDLVDGIKDNSVLRKINSKSSALIPQAKWGFADNKSIRVDPSFIDPLALYEFTYIAVNGYPHRQVSVSFELKTAASSGGIPAAAYQAVTLDKTLGWMQSYCKIRATIHGISDTRALRIRSIILKGIQN